MKLERSINEPIRTELDWDGMWGDLEKSLISAWERGRQKRLEDPDLAANANLGHLVLLPWKGGVEKAILRKDKVGVHLYLAMWQGLRGEDLDIDPKGEVFVTCTATGVSVLFTSDFSKYANQ